HAGRQRPELPVGRGPVDLVGPDDPGPVDGLGQATFDLGGHAWPFLASSTEVTQQPATSAHRSLLQSITTMLVQPYRRPPRTRGRQFCETSEMRLASVDDLRSIYRPPGRGPVDKVIDRLDNHCRDFIAKSPFFVLST